MKISYQILDSKRPSMLSVGEIKKFLRIDHDYDNSILDNLISTSISSAENFVRYVIPEDTISINIDNVSQVIELPVLPVNKIISVTGNYDTEEKINVKYTLFGPEKSHLRLSVDSNIRNINVTYVAGGNISHQVLYGIMLHVAEMYDAPEKITLSNAIKDLYKPYRRMIL